MTPADYLRLGWAVVPVDRERKTPVHRDWPARAAARDFTPADFEGRNVGVVLGAVSGDLVDVDLDSDAALALAPAFLPDTLTFGRKSKPSSHWLYTSPGLTAQKLWFESGNERELIEIRATNTDGQGCGHQTVFPGSVHPSGEAIEFENDQAPTEVDAAELRWAVARLAVAAAILNGWGEGSGRHEKSLGLAGGLLKSGWTPDEVRECLAAVREQAGDSRDNEKDFAHDVETTIKSFEAGREVQGFGTLVEAGHITKALAKDIERHALSPERRARAAEALKSGSPGRQLAAGVNDVAIIRELIAEASATPEPTTTPAAERVPSSGVTAAAGQAPDAPGTEPHGLLGRRINLGAEPELLAYLFERLPFAPGGKVNAIAGAPNAGKSPWALQMMLAHVSGKQCGPFVPLRPGWALYLDAETGVLAHRRWWRICRAHEVDPGIEGVDFRDVETMFSEQYCAELEAYCKAQGPNGLVVIDTYGAMLAADIDNNSPEFAHWLRMLGRTSRACAVVIVVLIHNTKSAKGGGLDGIAGNYQGAGAMQGVITLERTGTENEDPIKVICSRSPEHTFPVFEVKWEDVSTTPGQDLKAGGRGLRAVENATTEAPTTESTVTLEKRRLKVARGIVACLERTPGQSKRNVVKGTRGASEKEIGRVFDELVELGVVVETKVAEKRNAAGQAEAVMSYALAPLDNAGVEARLKAGLVE